MPGLQSDYSGLKTVLGEDEDFGFADYLNGILELMTLLFKYFANAFCFRSGVQRDSC